MGNQFSTHDMVQWVGYFLRKWLTISMLRSNIVCSATSFTIVLLANINAGHYLKPTHNPSNYCNHNHNGPCTHNKLYKVCSWMACYFVIFCCIWQNVIYNNDIKQYIWCSLLLFFFNSSVLIVGWIICHYWVTYFLFFYFSKELVANDSYNLKCCDSQYLFLKLYNEGGCMRVGNLINYIIWELA